jgi:hypothetical protein
VPLAARVTFKSASHDSGFGRVFFSKMFFQPIPGVLIDDGHIGSFLHGIKKLELGADQLVRFRRLAARIFPVTTATQSH